MPKIVGSSLGNTFVQLSEFALHARNFQFLSGSSLCSTRTNCRFDQVVQVDQKIQWPLYSDDTLVD